MSGSRSGFSVTITAIDAATAKIDAINKRIAGISAPAQAVTRSLGKLADTAGVTRLAVGMRNVAQESLQAFENIGRMVGPLSVITGAASLAGLARMASQWANTGTQLGLAATRSGMTVTQLSGLQGAAQLAGSSAEGLTAGMTSLKDAIFNLNAGRAAPETIAAFAQLGISTRNARGGLRSAAEVLPELADKLKAIQDPTQRAIMGTAALGSAYSDLAPFLARGSAGIAEYNALAKSYGNITDAGAEAANRLRVAQVTLSLATSGLGNAISETLEPVMSKMLTGMADFIKDHREVIATDVGAWAGRYAAGLGHVASAFDRVVTATVGWDNAIGIGLPLALSRTIGPIAKLENWLARMALVQLPVWLGRLLGIGAGGLAALTLPLGLKGDAGPNSGGVSPEQEAENRRQAAASGALTPAQWWRQHAPTWLGGSATPAAPTPGVGPRISNLPDGTAVPNPTLPNPDLSGPGRLAGRGQLKPIPGDVEREVRMRARELGLDEEHMVRIAKIEHGGYDNVSRAGARGPMQIMPDTLTDLAKQAGVTADPHDWRQNVQLGMRYYSRLLKNANGQYAYADAGYNAGANKAGVVHFRQTGDMSQLPNETKKYVYLANPAQAGAGAPNAQVQNGSGTGATPTPQEQTVRGSANVHIKLSGAPEGTRTTATSTGELFAGATPRVETAMPAFSP